MKKTHYTLSEYVAEAKAESGLSEQAIADRANKICKPIKEFKSQYVNDVINNKFGQPTVAKLQELAAGLGVVEEEIFLVARGLPISPENAPYNTEEAKALRWFRRLDANERAMIFDLMKTYIARSLRASGEMTEHDVEEAINIKHEP